MLISGRVSFRQEGQGIVYPSPLSSAANAYQSLAQNVWQSIIERTNEANEQQICQATQLAAYPFLRYFLVSIDSVIYVPSAF